MNGGKAIHLFVVGGSASGSIREEAAETPNNAQWEGVYNIQMIFKENNSIEHFRTYSQQI